MSIQSFAWLSTARCGFASFYLISNGRYFHKTAPKLFKATKEYLAVILPGKVWFEVAQLVTSYAPRFFVIRSSARAHVCNSLKPSSSYFI